MEVMTNLGVNRCLMHGHVAASFQRHSDCMDTVCQLSEQAQLRGAGRVQGMGRSSVGMNFYRSAYPSGLACSH